MMRPPSSCTFMAPLGCSNGLMVRRRARVLCFGGLMVASASLHTSTASSCKTCSPNGVRREPSIRSSPRVASTAASRRTFFSSRRIRNAEHQKKATAESKGHSEISPKAAELERERYTLASHPQSTFELLSWWIRDGKSGRPRSYTESNSGESALQRGFSSGSDSSLSSQVTSSPHEPRGEISEQPGQGFSGTGTGDKDRKNSISGENTAVQPDPKGRGRIHQLMKHPSLYLPVRVPRHTIVLCHGLYGFDVRGPFLGLEIHYWAATLDILRKKVGAEVLICGVPGTGSIQERAEALHKFLCSPEAGVQGKKLNFIGHSMGGLDVRHLITNIKPTAEQYTPISLTTVNTPHRGSPFMDWCNANVGVGNDIIEEAIRSATEASQRKRSSPAGDSEKGKAQAKADESEGIASVEVPRPPYSLKTPLFVRQKAREEGKKKLSGAPVGSADSTEGDQQPEAQPGLVESRAADAGDAQTKEKVDGKITESAKSGASGSLPFGLSAFTKALSSVTGSFSNYMLSVLDQPAYAMLSTRYMSAVFNPQTPDVPQVRYYSVAARVRKLAVWHPLWLPKLILDAAAESSSTGSDNDGSAEALGGAMQGNDGLVNVQSARWGDFLGVMEECDHWDLRGGGAPRWSRNLHPATGKPLPGKEQAAKKEAKEAEEKKKKIEDSWIDINKLLSAFRPSKKDGDKAVKKEDDVRKKKQPSSSSVSDSMQPVLAFLDNYAQLAGNDSEVGPGLSRGPEAGSKTGTDQDSLITEVVSWISDRLPERDEERRAAAELAADQFDAEEVRASLAGVPTALEQDAGRWTSAVITDAHLPTERGTRASEEPGVAEETREALRTTSEPAGGLTLASAPTWHEIASAPISMSAPSATVPHLLHSAPPASRDILPTSLPSSAKRETRLRRDAEWLEALGEGDKARELRRELQWHRAQYVDTRTSREAAGFRGDEGVEDHVGPNASVRLRPPSDAERATDWDAPKKKKGEHGSEEVKAQKEEDKKGEKKQMKEEKKMKDDEVELERFWVALCRHLWEQGH